MPCRSSLLLSAGLSLLLVSVTSVSLVMAESSTSESVTVRKTEEGLHFQLPPDWPVEKRGGVVGPIPVEEYLAQKFKALGATLQALEQRLDGVDLRLRVLEEESKKARQGFRSSEATQ